MNPKYLVFQLLIIGLGGCEVDKRIVPILSDCPSYDEVIEASNQYVEDCVFGNCYNPILNDTLIYYLIDDQDVSPKKIAYFWTVDFNNSPLIGTYDILSKKFNSLFEEDLEDYPVSNMIGRYVALRSDRQLWDLYIDSGFTRKLTEGSISNIDYALANDGRLIYSTTAITGIYNTLVIDENLDTLFLFTDPYILRLPEWSLDNSFIAYYTHLNNTIGIVNSNDYSIERSWPVPAEVRDTYISDIAFGTTNEYFYWITYTKLFRTNTITGQTILLNEICDSKTYTKLWSSPDHSRIYIKIQALGIDENKDLIMTYIFEECDGELNNCRPIVEY
jgi:hypothetical protein